MWDFPRPTLCFLLFSLNYPVSKDFSSKYSIQYTAGRGFFPFSDRSEIIFFLDITCSNLFSIVIYI